MASDPEISQEELDAYLAQLREAPIRDVIAQAASMLLTAAQAKLGRPDARRLIDAANGVLDGAGDALGDVREPLQQAIAQLKMAQVQAERDAGVQPPPEADQPSGAEQPASPPRQPQQPPQPPQPKATDRLWIPGQG